MNNMQVQNNRPRAIEIAAIVITSIATLTALSNKGYFAALCFLMLILIILSKYSHALKGVFWFLRERKKKIAGMVLLFVLGFISFPATKPVQHKIQPPTEIVTVAETDTVIATGSIEVQEEKSIKYIPNISAADVYMNYTNKGFKLTKDFISGGHALWQCTLHENMGSYEVGIFGTSPSEITAIYAMFTNYSNNNTDEKAAEFLGYVGTVQYENAEPETARRWIKKNINNSAKTKIGGVTYEIIPKKATRYLVIGISEKMSKMTE